jgi:hypothetical protein
MMKASIEQLLSWLWMCGRPLAEGRGSSRDDRLKSEEEWDCSYISMRRPSFRLDWVQAISPRDASPCKMLEDAEEKEKVS